MIFKRRPALLLFCCFFESGNHNLLKTITGTVGVLNEVAKKLSK